MEVGRREAEFALDFRPRNAVERELVRQIALASWRRQELAIRIVRHDARVNAARFANWDQDEQIAAAEIGRRLADDPEASVARLQRTSAGCAWLIVRWTLLGNGLTSAEDGGPDCTWTDADLTLVLNLFGRPADLRRLDDWPGHLEWLRDQAREGSDEAVTELRRFIADEMADLEKRLGRGLASGRRADAERLVLGAGHRPGARRDAAPSLRGGGGPAVSLGLDQAGADPEGESRAPDVPLRPRSRRRSMRRPRSRPRRHPPSRFPRPRHR